MNHRLKGDLSVFINREESRTKRRNRERILEAARKLFLEQGIYGTTMIDIAAEAGVERRTLYNYYENMEILAMELQVQYLMALQDAWVDVDDSQSGFEQARALLTSYCDYCITNPDLVNYTVQFDHYFRQSYENEDYERFGLSGELAAVVLEAGIPLRYARVCTQDTIPYARDLEDQALPNVQRFIDAALNLMA